MSGNVSSYTRVRLLIGFKTVKMHLFSSEDASPFSSECILSVAMIDIYFYTYFTPNCIFTLRKPLIIRTLQERVFLSPTAQGDRFERGCLLFSFPVMQKMMLMETYSEVFCVYMAEIG